MKQPVSIFRKAMNSLVSAAGYMPITKSELPTTGHFKSIALNTSNSYMSSIQNIKKNGLQKPGNVTFQMLKQIAKADALIRICVNVIKKSVSQCEWDIVVKQRAPKDKAYYESHIEKVRELFEFMNPNGENMRVLLDRVLEDLLVLDAGCIEKVRTLDGTELVALNSVDSATIRPIYNEYGELGTPAYKQFINSKPVAEFNQDEMVYMMANPQNDIKLFGYGLSPIESIILQVQASLEADLYNIKHFSKDNIPPGMIDLGGISNEDAEEFIAIWNATVLGNTHGMKFVWGGSDNKKYTPFNTSNKDMQYTEYIDWLSRIKLATYGLSGIDANIFQDVNRATAEVQAQISNSRGVASTKMLVEEYFTRQIIREMGDEFKWLEFQFKKAENLKDRKTQAEIDDIYIKNGARTPNEVRVREGQEELDEASFDEELDANIRDAIASEKTPLEDDKKQTGKVGKGFTKGLYD